jgi:hypothetical protein
MRQFTGFLIFSFLFMMPAQATEKGNVRGDCPSGSLYCTLCGDCVIGAPPCPIRHEDCLTLSHKNHIIPIKKKKNAIYSLPEGTVFKCEDKKKLKPLSVEKDGTTIYTCEPIKEKRAKEKP